MKLFTPIYMKMLAWSKHPKAPALLGGVSFAEAVVFPVPPEVMLAPMCLAQPKHAFRFAFISLLFSVLGALLGYVLGYYAWELVQPVLAALGWLERIDEEVTALREITQQSPWNVFWLLVVVGFTPIPLKIFTWASGVVGAPLLPFVAAMLIGRGKRVLLLALAIRLGGERAERALHRWIEPLGWGALVVLLLLGVGLLLHGHWA
jgi:membrane protein YqaA with SNARE-associated domain